MFTNTYVNILLGYTEFMRKLSEPCTTKSGEKALHIKTFASARGCHKVSAILFNGSA